MTEATKSGGNIEVAVIGEFQIGKSTFVNCLVGRNVAETGQGISTTHKAVSYPIGNGISIIDTPGFDAPGDEGELDRQEAMDAIRRSFVVIVYQYGAMGEVCRSLVKWALEAGKKCVFVYNCKNDHRWAPSENDDIIKSIEADAFNYGYSDSIVKLGNSIVYPVNVQWALFGLGLLENEKEKKKISRYAYDDLDVDSAADLQEEMLRQSNFPSVRRYIEGLPLEVLSDFLKNKERELRHFTDRFYEEFAKRLQSGGGK